MIEENKLSILINFILNGFIHVTLLFSFLVILYYFIISPLTEGLLHDQIGSIIDKIFDTNFPEPIVIQNNKLLTTNINSTQKENFDSSTYSIVDNANTNYLLDPTNLPINPNTLSSLLTNKQNLQDINFSKIIDNTNLNIDELKQKYINPHVINNLIEQNSEPDVIVLRNNKTIIYIAMYIAACLFILSIALTISFKFTYPEHVSVSHILIENLLTFSIIGYIEYWFFTTYAFKYSPLLPSELTKIVTENIKDILTKDYKYSTNVLVPQYTTEKIPLTFS
jgi:hypothetical protein